ncbi:hypothetical protein ABZP36_008284 [Zizania latifolia]
MVNKTSKRNASFLRLFSFIVPANVWSSAGVEKVELDRDENKVTVTGDFEPEKVLKKIKKKTGKKAEILVPEEDEEEEECTAMGHFAHAPYYDLVPLDEERGEDVAHELQSPARWEWYLHSFDDENTEACRVM